MQTTVAVPWGDDVAYGLGLTRYVTSCGTTLRGHGGGMTGSISLAVTTADGGHQLAFNRNGDWEAGVPDAVMEAEYRPARLAPKALGATTIPPMRTVR